MRLETILLVGCACCLRVEATVREIGGKMANGDKTGGLLATVNGSRYRHPGTVSCLAAQICSIRDPQW
jgi:hypothetical protein